MAGDWLKMEVALPEKPEVWQIAGILRIDPDAVVGKLLKVWRWFDAHTESGNAHGVTYALVDSITGVTGFGEAMALCSWLEQDGSILRLPHFDRHNGKTAKNRALTAKRVAKTKEKSNAKGNAHSVTTALPREEKRREEEKQEKQEKPRTKGKAPEVTLTVWMDGLEGADAIPADDPLFDWAQTTGIPRDWIALAWWGFEARYAESTKTYADWRAVFRRAVREDWLKLWRNGRDGWELTTAGVALRREMGA